MSSLAPAHPYLICLYGYLREPASQYVAAKALAMPIVRFVELPGLYQPYEFVPVLDHSVSRGSLLVAVNAACLFATVDSKALRLENFLSKYPNMPSGSSFWLV